MQIQQTGNFILYVYSMSIASTVAVETRQQSPACIYAYLNGFKVLTSSRHQVDVSGAFPACSHIAALRTQGSTERWHHHNFCYRSGSSIALRNTGPMSVDRSNVNHDLSLNKDVHNMKIPIVLKTTGFLVVDKPWGVRMDGDFEVMMLILAVKI
jgi:hypothetical protein